MIFFSIPQKYPVLFSVFAIVRALGSQLFKESEEGNNSHICGLK